MVLNLLVLRIIKPPSQSRFEFHFGISQWTSELSLNYCVHSFHCQSSLGLKDRLESESVMSPDTKALISEMIEVWA